jgi:hypothetical protein
MTHLTNQMDEMHVEQAVIREGIEQTNQSTPCNKITPVNGHLGSLVGETRSLPTTISASTRTIEKDKLGGGSLPH